MTLHGYRVHALVDPARRFVHELPVRIESFYQTLARRDAKISTIISSHGFDTGVSVLVEGRLPSRISLEKQDRIRTLLDTARPLTATLEHLQYGTKRASEEPVAPRLRGQSDAFKAALTAFIDDLRMTLWKENVLNPENHAALERFQTQVNGSVMHISTVVTATERLKL
ncbi:hypothetical protein HY493_03130 [Candidatus Woesearchaeota archaeon]|nr:hypothetical protein [Candidatus Woesearchaeota archaeon]